MGFSNGSFARLFTVNNMGNYSSVGLAISAKNKTTGEYEPDFRDGYVRFVGKAHNMLGRLNLPTREADQDGNKGASVKLIQCMVTNTWMKEENGIRTATYNKNPVYTVFDFEIDEDNPSSNRQDQKSAKPTQNSKPASAGGINEVDDDELPF